MSATPTRPIASLQNLMIQLGAAVPNTMITGSAVGYQSSASATTKQAPRKSSKAR